MDPQLAADQVVSDSERLFRQPQTWWHLDPSVYGIADTAQEDARRRAHQDPPEVEVAAYRDGFQRAHQDFARLTPQQRAIRVQLDYALTAAVMGGRIVPEDREVLARPWNAAVKAATSAHRHQAAREADVTDLAITSRERERFMAGVRMGEDQHTFIRSWGTLSVKDSGAGPVYSVTRRRSAPWVQASLMPLVLSGLPVAPAGVVLALVLVTLAGLFHFPGGLVSWVPLVTLTMLLPGLVFHLAAAHRVQPGSPLEYLLTLESHGKDADLLAQLVKGGWTWDQLDRPEVSELVELSGSGEDAGLASGMLTSPGAVSAEAVELVEAAAHALALAERLGMQEVAVEVPALVRECSTTEDMRAAIVQLDQLGDDLARLAQVEQAHRAEVEAPVIEAREREARDLAEHAREAARVRAVAALESSRAAVRLTTKAHQAVMQTSSSTDPSVRS